MAAAARAAALELGSLAQASVGGMLSLLSSSTLAASVPPAWMFVVIALPHLWYMCVSRRALQREQKTAAA